MVMLAFAMMAVDPPSCQSAAAKKKATPNHGKNKTIGASSLIRWSIQEVRRIANLGSLESGQPAHIIAWSLWRRAHQAIARARTSKQNGNCQC